LTGPEVYSNTELPSKEKFYDSLREKYISDNDYAHALEVWAEFGCTTLRDYSKIYVDYIIAKSNKCLSSFSVFWGNGDGIFVFNEQKIDIRL
jgi:hypothetical protein